MEKNVFFAPLFLYNLALITHDATKSVNPSIEKAATEKIGSFKINTFNLSPGLELKVMEYVKQLSDLKHSFF